MFVVASDFDLPPYLLPSLKSNEQQMFDNFIAQEETRALKDVLGDDLYNAFVTGITPEWSATAATVIGQQYAYGNDIWEALTVQTGIAPVEGPDWTQVEEDNRWLLLKNGSTYMVGDKKYRWVGMKEALKPLIYSLWAEHLSVSLTHQGFTVPKTENSISVPSISFVCRAWNDYARYIGYECEPYNTLWGYLYYTNMSSGVFDDTFDETFDTFVDYLNYEFQWPGRKNEFGI